jgi:RP/EB family microtubule-associated protein
MSNIGMMDGAFFVGRKELVDWVNETLEINIAKIEQTANGAMACQLFDIMHPGTVAVTKINWMAKQEFEHIVNYKVLQTAFTKKGIDKHIDVDRLIKGKYQDNLEFMQWFKRFFEMAVQDKGDYDCVAVRLRGKGGAEFNNSTGRRGGAPSVASTRAPAPRSRAIPATAARPASRPSGKTAGASSAVAPAPAAEGKASSAGTAAKKHEANSAAAAAEIAELKAANEALTQAMSEKDMEMEGLEKERTFYFDKLRDIEMMLQDTEDSGRGDEMTASIFKVSQGKEVICY